SMGGLKEALQLTSPSLSILFFEPPNLTTSYFSPPLPPIKLMLFCLHENENTRPTSLRSQSSFHGSVLRPRHCTGKSGCSRSRSHLGSHVQPDCTGRGCRHVEYPE